MFSKSKRALGVALAAMMIASAFAGCSGGSNTSSAAASGDSSSSADSSASTVEAMTIDDAMKNADKSLGDEGKDSEVKLKVWAPSDAIDVVKKECEAFTKNFSDRKITIEVVAQGESDAATALMNDPDAAADVFGFASDQATKLYPDNYVAKVRLNYAEAIKGITLEGSLDVANFQTSTDDQSYMYAYPETGDNSYVMFYNKSLITEEQMGSLESIMKVCDEKDKNMIIDFANGYYACMVELTGGGTYSLGDNQNQLLNYDKEKIMPVAKAFSNLFANDKHFVSDNVDSVLPSALKNGTALCGVAGPWKTKALKNALGDNYAVCKLPTINVDGKDTQLISMYGYKYMGVNAKTKFPYTAQTLAYYLTSETCQKERMEELGWGPSINSLIESDFIKNDVTLSAIYEQQKNSVPQKDLAGSFWDPTGGFGKYITDKSNDLSDAGIEKAYDSMVTSITAQ